MSDKKIVDDYYSQINPNDSENKKEPVKKPIVATKKKIVVRKAAEIKADAAIKEEKKLNDIKNASIKQNNQNEQKKSKNIVQKIEVIKRGDRKETTTAKPTNRPPYNNNKSQNQGSTSGPNQRQQQRPNTSTGANNNNTNRSENTRPDFKSTNPSQQGGDFKGGSSHFQSNDSGFKKTFSNNKHPGAGKGKQKTKDDEDSKKPKLNTFGKTRGKIRFSGDEDLTFTRSNKLQKLKKEEKKAEDIKQNLVERVGETILVGDFLSVKELSEKLGVILPKLIAEFMKNGMMVTINSKVDFETASIIGDAFGIKLERENSLGASVEDIVLGDISSFLTEDDQSKLIPRSPVVSIMGHVDHGKTSLLDYIRSAKIAAGEAGGITQSIGAYQVELPQGNITFLDTPGHEAFTVMRARGAKSTDIAILVVAADEGVKPQTIESISHAREANIPVIVAINKMDKVGANPDHVKGQLAEHGLLAEDWGGDVPMVPVSAHTGFGIDDLLEIILLVAEMKELKANPDRNGVATVIESHLDGNLGPVATVLINTGTINSGDNIVCQDSYGKVKILKNYQNTKVKFAKPGEPVLIVGLDRVVDGGDILQVVNTPDIAKSKAIEYKTLLEKQKKAGSSGLELLMSKIKSGNLKQLKIILKADTNGSLEAIKNALVKLSTPETTVSIILSGVGSITEGDILMGKGSDAILVGFSVGVLPTAKSTLESAGVEYISSDIIYHITDKIEKIVTGMLDPKEVEVILGKAKVGGIFFTDKKFMILGLVVQPENRIEANTMARVIRKKKMIGTGKIESLKQGTLEVKEVEGPTECGIKFVSNVEIENGDELEIYKIEIQK
ncbi:MAG: translation initiation factor IF-2 [Candidatus Gracilibacteria bacterium]|nr:translation initiation factor IF-2 [Candidatus Gracilibacteria bacterium]